MKYDRIEYIDVAKGVTILLVVLGHVSSLPTPIMSSLYSFHMPLFFLLSGFFFRQEDCISTAKRMIPTIVVPYIVVGGVIRGFCIVKNVLINHPFDYIDLLSLFGVCWKINGTIVSSGAIWFLMVLFWSKIFLQFAFKYKYGIPCLLVLATVSMLVTRIFNIIIPFGVQQALPCSLFVYAGFLCNKYRVFDIRLSKYTLIAVVVAMLPFLNNFSVATRANSYQGGFLSILVSCAIVWVIVMSLRKLVEIDAGWYTKLCTKKFFTWCGRSSIVILAVHSIEARYFAYNSQNFVIESLVRLTCILILSWLFTNIPFTRKLFHVK